MEVCQSHNHVPALFLFFFILVLHIRQLSIWMLVAYTLIESGKALPGNLAWMGFILSSKLVERYLQFFCTLLKTQFQLFSVLMKCDVSIHPCKWSSRYLVLELVFFYWTHPHFSLLCQKQYLLDELRCIVLDGPNVELKCSQSNSSYRGIEEGMNSCWNFSFEPSMEKGKYCWK